MVCACWIVLGLVHRCLARPTTFRTMIQCALLFAESLVLDDSQRNILQVCVLQRGVHSDPSEDLTFLDLLSEEYCVAL